MASQFDLVTFIDDHIWIIGSLGALIFLYIIYLIFKITVNKLELNDNFPKEKLQFLAKLDKKEKKPQQKALKKKGKNKKAGNATDEQNAENGDDSGSTTTTTVSESVDMNKETEQKPSPPVSRKQKNAASEGQNKQKAAVASEVEKKPSPKTEKKPSPVVERKQKPAHTVAAEAKTSSKVESKSVSEVAAPESKPSSAAAPEVENKNNKKKNKAKKVEAEAVKKENTPPQSAEEPSKIHEVLFEVIEKRDVLLEEAGLQQAAPSAQEKSRKKRDVQEPEDDNALKNLQTKLRENEKKIQSKDNEITKLKAELTKAQKDVAEKQSQSTSFAQQLKITQEALNDACQPKSNPEFEQLTKENFDLKARLQAAEAHAKEAQSLKSQLADARKPSPELEKLRKEHFDLKARLQAAEAHAKEAETLKAQLAEARKPNPELEKLRKEQFDLKARLQAAEKHVKEAESLKDQLAQLKNTPPPQPIIDSSLQQRVTELEEELKKSAESTKLIQTLQSENKHLKDRELQVSAEIDALNREVDEIQHIRLEKENIAQQASDNTEELNKLRRDNDELDKKVEICNASIAKLNIELKKAFAETMEHKKERDELKKTVESLIAEKEELTKAVDINEKKIADFTDFYNEASSKTHELQNYKNSLEMEKNDLKLQLKEERARVEELEQSSTSQPSESDSAKVKELEAQVEKLNQKKAELYELTMSLGEKVRTAENQAEKVLKDCEKLSSESFGKAAEVIAKSLKTLNVNLSERTPKTHDEFNVWAEGLPTVLQKIITVEKQPVAEKAASSSHNNSNAEIKKLKEDVKHYERSIKTLENQLHAIEVAYAEREAELKAEINTLEQTQRS